MSIALGLLVGAGVDGKDKRYFGPVIVSPSRPHDSRGEVVYEVQGPNQRAVPTVAGTFVEPVAILNPAPRYPALLRISLAIGDISIEGVVAENGEFIDSRIGKVDAGIDKLDGAIKADALSEAVRTAARWRFKPGTLNGKPVAVAVTIVVRYRL